MIHRVYSKRDKKLVWAINVTIDRKRIRKSGYETKDEAKDAIAALRLRQRARDLGLPTNEPEITLKQLLDARKKDASIVTKNQKVQLATFEKFVAFTGGDVPVKTVSKSHLRAFRDSLSVKYTPNTRAVRMVGMAVALNAAGQYFPELESYRAPRLGGNRLTFRSVLVPKEEFQTVVNYLRNGTNTGYWGGDALELLALTGARVSEILNIKESDIDWDRELLTINATKTRNKRQVPITARAAVLLRRWQFGVPFYNSLLTRTRTAQKKNKIATDAGSWRIHDIRHTAASLMAEAGISHGIIAAMLGHTLRGTTALYVHASLPALRQASLVLERWCIEAATPKLRAV